MNNNAIETLSSDDMLELTANVAAAYVIKNTIPARDLPSLITSVHAAFAGLGKTEPSPDEDIIKKPTPAQIRKSITPDALISFINGKPYKTLKRHLAVHGLGPSAYRKRYGLPADYPMTAPGYSERRSVLAKSLGLGQ